MLVAMMGSGFRVEPRAGGIMCTSFGLSATHAPSATMFSTQQEQDLYTLLELHEGAMWV